MSRTIEKTLFMWEKGRGDKCRPGPKSCLPRARPVLRASVNEWHKAVRWESRGTEAEWRVPMPSKGTKSGKEVARKIRPRGSQGSIELNINSSLCFCKNSQSTI